MKTVYRVLTALFGLAVLPVLFFVPLLRFKMTLPLKIDLGIPEYSGIFGLIRSVSAQTDQQKELMHKLMEAITDKNSQFGAIFTNRPWFYAFLVFLCVTALVGLALCVLSFIVKKPGPLIAVSCGGLLSAVLMNATFNAFAKPLLSGKIGLKSLLGGGGAADSGGLSSLLTGLIGNAVTVDQLKLSFAYLLVLALFGLAVFVCVAAIVEKSNEK